jgi:hypothetical protein
LLLPLMAASRLRGRKPANDDTFHEFRLSPWVNRLFTNVLRAEIRTTLAGMRWPAGGSRIVVGRAV